MSVEISGATPVIDPATKKIKIQKRTPTERQIEALEKARQTKQKNKLKAEIQKENPSVSFLMPSPYLVGTIFLGLGGLVAYSYLRQETNLETTPRKSTEIQMEPIPQQEASIIFPETKNQPSPATQAFFNGSTKI